VLFSPPLKESQLIGKQGKLAFCIGRGKQHLGSTLGKVSELVRLVLAAQNCRILQCSKAGRQGPPETAPPQKAT